jgi:hypothetical protein
MLSFLFFMEFTGDSIDFFAFEQHEAEPRFARFRHCSESIGL